MNPSGHIYAYKMTADNGGAPCVWRGVLSLAICKPMIRRRAEVGDLILGFGGKDLGGRLIYAAVVSAKLERDSYYRERKYADRPDCIYFADTDGHAQRKPDAQYHKDSDQRAHDVGARFERAHVLLSDNFRYFGASDTTDFRSIFPRVASLVQSMGRGHRVNFHRSVSGDLVALKEMLWRDFPKKKSGEPSQADKSRRCNTGCSWVASTSTHIRGTSGEAPQKSPAPRTQ